MRTQCILTVIGLFAAACGSDTDMAAPTSPYATGFNPPAASPGEQVFLTPIFKNLTPGTDVTLCTYLDQYFDSASDVTNFRVYQAKPGHHMVVYAAKQKRSIDTHPCTEDDMVNSRFVAGGGADFNSAQAQFQIPDGLAFRFAAGAQVMVQTHWLNATEQTFDGQGVAYITTAPSSPQKQVLDLFNVYTTQIDIPAGQTVTVTTSCKMKHDVTMYSIIGHEHDAGTRVEVAIKDDTTTNMLWAHDWLPEYLTNPPINIYPVDKPLLLKAGQTFTTTCSWKNTTPKDLRFPSEMCVGSGFYYPSVGEIDCEDGDWSEG